MEKSRKTEFQEVHPIFPQGYTIETLKQNLINTGTKLLLQTKSIKITLNALKRGLLQFGMFREWRHLKFDLVTALKQKKEELKLPPAHLYYATPSQVREVTTSLEHLGIIVETAWDKQLKRYANPMNTLIEQLRDLPNQWTVQSRTFADKKWLVKLESNGKLTCNCPNYIRAQKCFHTVATEEYLKNISKK